MLKQIERSSPVCVQGNDFTVDERIVGKARACSRDARKVFCKHVSSTGPEIYAARVSPGEASVAIQLYFVHPGIAGFWQLCIRRCEHGLNKFYSRLRQRFEILIRASM